jgi:hypothetical protein
MDYAKAFKDFISLEERDVLNDWTLSNYKSDCFMDPQMDSKKIPNTKLTTRFASPLFVNNGTKLILSNSDFLYPELVYKLQRKIILTFEFEDYGFSPVGKDGIITEIGFEPGTVHPHTDPVWFPDTHTVHFNLITQKPESGGVTHINNEPWDINDTDLLTYIVSDAEHYVDEIVGKTERILWVFSFMLSKSDTQRIFS